MLNKIGEKMKSRTVINLLPNEILHPSWLKDKGRIQNDNTTKMSHSEGAERPKNLEFHHVKILCNRFLFSLLVILFLSSTQVFAQGKRAFTPLDRTSPMITNIPQNKYLTGFTAEDLWNLKRLSSLTVSPDGNFGCFTATEYNIKENKGNSDIWLIDLKTYQLKKLTTNLGSDGSPAWHPNSNSIAFISKREGDHSQLYSIPIDGGEASLVTEMPMGISSPKYFKDEKKIVFVSQILPDHENDFS